jgi:lysyl-tRNA synthetase class 2
MSEENQTLAQRKEKAESLADLGVKLYTNSFKPANCARELLPKGEALQAQQAEPGGAVYSVAGRVLAMRKFGKAAFCTIADTSGQIQIYVKLDILGEEVFETFKKWDIGDIVGVVGTLFKTKVGELSLQAGEIIMISKSLRPLPDKWHGLSDVETRYRQRYVDLIVTPETRETFRKRVEIIRLVREHLVRRNFMEVETPMMQPIPGGATAKPFKTHHNALGMDLYLRIAPELYLKRLLVGGFERVFEINRNFRNEGLSTRHNPEFTMLEFYWAYAEFTDLMDLTEDMLSIVARDVCGSTVVTYQEQEIDLTPGKWTRISFHDSLEKIGGVDPLDYNDYDRCAALVRRSGEKVVKGEKLGKLQAKLFDIFVEPKLIQPHFIYHYPTDISPLSRRNEANPDITDRFELFVVGRELANAFSELNDPVDQRGRFEEQVQEKAAGDDEAHFMDEDYVRALEYGMPPAAGQGIGIDRLVMLLTDSPSIREVILFPLLRLETPSGGTSSGPAGPATGPA